MGFIRNAGDTVADIKETVRWYSLLEPIEAMKVPELKLRIKHVGDATMNRLARPFVSEDRKKSKDIDLNREMQFRKQLLLVAVDGWEGMCNENARRLSDYFMNHPELFDESSNGEQWNFDKNDLAMVGEHINSGLFAELLGAITDLESFAKTRLEQEKNAQGVS